MSAASDSNNALTDKWQRLKNSLKKTWSTITDDEWENTKGDFGAINGLVQKKYGQNEHEVQRTLSAIYKNLMEEVDDINVNKNKELF